MQSIILYYKYATYVYGSYSRNYNYYRCGISNSNYALSLCSYILLRSIVYQIDKMEKITIHGLKQTYVSENLTVSQ